MAFLFPEYYSNNPGFFRMLELSVAAFCAYQISAIAFNEFDDFSNFHLYILSTLVVTINYRGSSSTSTSVVLAMTCEKHTAVTPTATCRMNGRYPPHSLTHTAASLRPRSDWLRVLPAQRPSSPAPERERGTSVL